MSNHNKGGSRPPVWPKDLTRKIWLVLVSITIIHLVCNQAAAPLRRTGLRSPLTVLSKRDLNSFAPLNGTVGSLGNEEIEEPASLLNYQKIWQEATPHAKPFVFAGLVLWLVFLFAFVGITASDFFCPNLSTIANRLGLSESVAGVTFLAFSNGSPDVFSTFAALRSNSGSLAVGELLGAASFIVSVVAGTMCLIQPFRVARHSFLRDVGFFTVAVSFTLLILYDSHIHAWEAIGMVILYFVYVMVVAVGSWWYGRREKQREVIRRARDEYSSANEVEEQYLDDPPSPQNGRATHSSSHSSLPHLSITPTPAPLAKVSPPATPSVHLHNHQLLDEDTIFSLAERGTPVTLTRARSGSSATLGTNIRTPGRPVNHRRAKSRSSVRPSLLGAIEFRDVVNSLRTDSSARTLAVFGGQGSEDHTHATLVGSGVGGPGGRRSGRMRASSDAGDRRIVNRSRSKVNEMGRRTTFQGDDAPLETHRQRESGRESDETESHWNESDEDEDEEEGINGGEGRLIDLSAGVENPWEETLSKRPNGLKIEIPSFQSSARVVRSARTSNGSRPESLKHTSSAGSLSSDRKVLRKVPSIMLTTESGNQSTVLAPGRLSILSRLKQKWGYRMSRAVFLALFPSLQDFREKSVLGKATAVLCVPAILVLNLTLPVVDTDDDECCSVEDLEEHEHDDIDRNGYKDDEAEEDEPDPANERHQRNHAPTEGLLVDTGPSANPSYSSVGRPARSPMAAIGSRLHSKVLAHHEDFVETPSPWATTSDLERIDRNLREFSFQNAPPKSFVGDVGSEEEEVDDSEVTVQVKIPSTETSRTPSHRAITPPGTPIPGDISIKSHDLTRWLTVVQCTLGPVFCTVALFSDQLVWWYPCVSLIFGLFIASLAFYFFEDHRHPARISLCFVGFFVAMVWILTIVNEVVGVLQTFGHIFGLSDAILGLTIFAMGNSLGDLVANATVARMGYPSMAIAACFGGPMLNILLGVGLSGSYMIFKNGGEPLKVELSHTLLVSGCGLLLVLVSTLIMVPLNGYWMNKRMGAGLIAAYVVVLTTNICVEIWL